jgi:hypothetical protein
MRAVTKDDFAVSWLRRRVSGPGACTVFRSARGIEFVVAGGVSHGDRPAHRRGAPRLGPNSCVRLHVNDAEDTKLIVTIPTSSAARQTAGPAATG